MQETINILGTEYLVEKEIPLNEEGKDGLYFPYRKKIYTRNKSGLLDDTASDTEKQIRLQEVLRHEITHAFFHESGLDEYCDDERLVDWFAIQSPKIYKVFAELDLL